MHILRVANFVSPTSGGIKTALRHWGTAYRARGHEVSLVIPGPGAPLTREVQGTVHRLPGVPVGRTGYSLLLDPRRLARTMERIAPDAVEVSDRTTTRWVGGWARRHGIPSVMVSHENVTGVLQRRSPLPDGAARWVADRLNLASAGRYDAIVCPSAYAAEEFHRHAVPAQVVPLGVDLEVFRPSPDHGQIAPDGSPRSVRVLEVVHCGRLSPEKNPGLSVATLRALVERGVAARLTVLGHGPLREELAAVAADLPVTFHPYITDRHELAGVLGRADVAVAPGPVETFGLAALEALACGVPTVCPDEGALREVVGEAGISASSRAGAFADAVLALAGRPQGRAAARRQAQRYTWERSANEMLRVHEGLQSSR